MPPLLLAAVLAVVFASSDARLASPRLSSLDPVRFRTASSHAHAAHAAHAETALAAKKGTAGAAEPGAFQVPRGYDRRERPGDKKQVRDLVWRARANSHPRSRAHRKAGTA